MTTIAPYLGDRAALQPLFRQADDSDRAIAAYRSRGIAFAAIDGDRIVGQVLLVEDREGWEVKSLAVVQDRRREGVGRQLMEAGLAHARERGTRRVVVATAAADTHMLRFYQRLGFRMLRVERDAFTPEAGYPPDLVADGIRNLDRVWLDLRWPERG